MSKAERTRQFIIEKAAPIINTKGIAATSVDDIILATKMAKGGIYGRFENREELIDESIEYLLKKFSSKIISVLMHENSAQDKISAYLDLYKDPLSPYIAGGCPIMNIGSEVADTNPKIKAKVRDIIIEFRQLLVDILKKGIQMKELSGDLDAESFVLKMMAMIEGGVLISKVLSENKPVNDIIDIVKKELASYNI